MKWILLFGFTLWLSSCEKKASFDEPDKMVFDISRCLFVNKSGVEIAVVVKYRGSCGNPIDFPDSLVLQPDKEYGWDISYPGTKYSPVFYAYPPLGNVLFIKLYFNKTIGVDMFYKELHSLNYYTEELNPQKYKHIWTYTFTKEDYQGALEQNNTEK